MTTNRFTTPPVRGQSPIVHDFFSPRRIDPAAPAGGGGPGRFISISPNGSFHTDHYTSQRYYGIDRSGEIRELARRSRNLYLAYRLARDKYAAPMILEETGQGLKEILEGLIPVLLTALLIVAGSTGLGAALGGAIGFLFGGAGAGPGALLGAEAGLDAGLALLNWLGIGFLIIYVAGHLEEVLSLMQRGILRAWNAGGGAKSEGEDVEESARELARALALLVRLILEGIVAYLLAEGLAAVAIRAGRLVASLKKSRFGQGFAGWVEKHFEALIDDPRFNPNKRNRMEGKGSSPGEGTQTQAERTHQARRNESQQRPISGRRGHVSLDKVRFSQSRVSPIMSDGTPIEVAAEDLRKNGWNYSKGVPDMVEYPDGRIVTVDHRRLLAAKMAGMEEVPARIHPASEEIAGELGKKRFKLRLGFTDPETGIVYKTGQIPSNWGEAAKFRCVNQRTMGFADFPVEGSPEFPEIYERKGTR